tara:strand:+ start:805 stop:1545 length:741 start_codon:yes stop_codon:yes gene_type:complete
MKIRWPELAEFLKAQPEFENLKATMIELYNRSPERGRLKFLQTIEDEFKASCVSRGRSSNGQGGAAPWRIEQKSLYSGRGAKWRKVFPETSAYEALIAILDRFDSDGDDTTKYRGWIETHGFAWIRYSSPRGDVVNQLHAFEVRIKDSRLDHKDHMITLTNEQAQDLEKMEGTPFALGIEGTRRVVNKPKVEAPSNDEEPQAPAEDPNDFEDEDPTPSPEDIQDEDSSNTETQVMSADDLLADLGI